MSDYVWDIPIYAIAILLKYKEKTKHCIKYCTDSFWCYSSLFLTSCTQCRLTDTIWNLKIINMKLHIMIQLSRHLWHLPTSPRGHKYRDKCYSYAKYMPDVIHACMRFALYTLTLLSKSGSSSSLFLCEDFLYSSWGI